MTAKDPAAVVSRAAAGPPVRILWVFDFDGTLSPLVPDRTEARLHPASRALLRDLAADPGNGVAVLSSRSLDDLVPRVPVARAFLGGGSGFEWRLPGGHRVLPGEAAERKLAETREAVLPLLGRLSVFPGVDLEDKRWSVAVHFRRVLPEAMSMLAPLLAEIAALPGIRVFRGPSAAEVLFFRGANKSFGVRRLCRILNFDPASGRLVYAGDDENDAVAMRWILSRKGTALVVGDRVRVRGARNVADPADLARVVRALSRQLGAGSGRREGEGAACGATK
ncbi:MAG: trehalose-phosphatase [Deltaproteobacteria bacterium]|nr:trehalose-phosphatase [Deltaproteobacteria bacterium]